MKVLISILAVLTGLFMLIDGIYVTITGKYIGPPEPGPWALLFKNFGIDVYKLGWLFILYGAAWCIWLYGLWTGKDWVFIYGILISILTLWYLPVGTLFSLLILGILLFKKQNIGL